MRIGDVNLGLADDSEEVRNEGQLLHALRGRLQDVGLDILRIQDDLGREFATNKKSD